MMFILDTEEQEIRQKIAFLKGWRYSIVSNIPFQMVPPEEKRVFVTMCPDWTKKLSDTEELLSEMRQEFTVEISTNKNFTAIELWSDKSTPSYYKMMFDADAETLELAICLAYIA